MRYCLVLASYIIIDIIFFLNSFPSEGTHSGVRAFRFTFKISVRFSAGVR